MFSALIILILIASILMIGIVLIQKSKGGGLASNFASSNQIMGVRKTTNFVEKATWTLAIVICVLSIVSSFFAPKLVSNSRVQAAPQEQTAAPFQTEAPAQQAPAEPYDSGFRPALPPDTQSAQDRGLLQDQENAVPPAYAFLWHRAPGSESSCCA